MSGARTRMRRAVLVTVVVSLAGSGLAIAARQTPEERSQQKAADAAIVGFNDTLAKFDVKQSKRLEAALKKKIDDYPELLKVADRAVKEAPAVPRRGTTAYGREHSDAYRDAIRQREGIVGPYENLARLLRTQAIPASRFVKAGRAALAVDPAELLKDKYIVTGAPLREFVLPAFKKAQKRLKQTKAPEDAKLLAADLQAFVDAAIRQTRDGANRIDKQKPFFFDFGTQPHDLLVRLNAYESQVGNEVAVVALGISGGA